MKTRQKRTRGGGALRVYEGLRRDILTMALRPNELLEEATIASRYDVSRSPVREALIRLASEGLVRALPNRSAVVASLNIEEFPAYLDALDLIQRVTTRLAASLRSEEDLLRIKQEQEAFEQALARRDALAMIETNRNLHIAISEAGQNRYFTSLYARLLDEGRRMLRIYFVSLNDSLPPELESEHREIIKAIEDQDADLAEKLAHDHAIQVGERFLGFLGTRRTEDIELCGIDLGANQS